MRKFYLMLCALALILSACQSPRPQPMDALPVALATPLPPMAAAADKTPSACAPRLSQQWSLWRATQQPLAVQALLADQETLWAGTPFGVFRVDPRTGAFALSLDYQTSGETTKLFPMGDGRLWAEGRRGQFYYDGKEWMPLQITGTRYSPSIWAVDVNGDVWLESSMYRQSFYFRLPGHVPPSPTGLWKATAMRPTDVGVSIGNCQPQAYREGSFTYRSQAECQALKRAKQTFHSQMGSDLAVLDADGSLWWVTVELGPQGDAQTLLGHVGTGQPSEILQVPGYFLYAMAPDPTHGIWLGMDKGLVYSDGQSLRWITFGLDTCTIPAESDGTRTMVVDAQGKAWAATKTGVYALSPGELDWRPVLDPSPSNQGAARPIQAITAAPGGGIWATHGYDLFRVGSTTTLKPVQPPDPRCFMQFLAADSEFVWFSRRPTSGASVCDLMQFVVSAQAWAYHPVPKGYLGQVVIGSDGTVYGVGPEGLYRRVVIGPRSEFRPVGAKGANRIAADKQGGIWVASREKGGLWHYKSGRLTPHGQQFKERSLQQITVDSQNRLWAALSDTLHVYDGKTWQRIETPLRQIRELTSGPDGRIWIVGDIGIAVYDPAADKQP